MINGFMRFLGTVLLSWWDHALCLVAYKLQSNTRETQNTPYYHQLNNNDIESGRFQTNTSANQNGNYSYQYDDESSRANLLVTSRAQKSNSLASLGSPASSNASPNNLPTNLVSPPPTVRSSSLSNNLVCKPNSPPVVLSFVDGSNEFKTCPPSKIESNAHVCVHTTKIGSDASNVCLVCHPTAKVVSGSVQINQPFEQPDVKLNISTSSFTSKALSSSSPQRPDYSELIQSYAKLKASTSSFPSKDVSSSSPQKPDVSFGQSDANSNTSTSSLPTKSIQSSPSKPANSCSMQCVSKSNNSKNFPASNPIPVASPTPKAVSSPIYSTKQTNTCEQSDAKSKTSMNSLFTKYIQSSLSKPANASSVQWVVKSNNSKNFPAPEPIPAASPTPKAFSTPIYSTKQTNTFEQSDAKSTSSLPTKYIQSSPSKPANSSSMQWAVKSNNKNFPASNPVPEASPTPKAVSSPIYSTKQTNTSPFLQSDAGWHSSKTLSSSKLGPDQSEFRDSKSNASTNSLAPPEGGPGAGDGKDPKKPGKSSTQTYEIPKHIEEMFKKDIVPPVLQMPLSPDTYVDYFATLLYAEDFYCEKWSDYLLKNVTLKLRTKENSGLQGQSDKKKNKKDSKSKMKKNNYPYVVFEITDVPERRPYLLSRDHVHLKPLDKSKDKEPFHGVLFPIEKSTTILAEFEEDFHRQHEPSKKYDISFSFNRVCLKRAHRAVSAAANPLLRQILFPKTTTLPSQWDLIYPMNRILNHKLAPIPYLIEGPFIKDNPHQFPTWMLNLIKDTVLKIYESSIECRVLICAPKNSTCDEITRAIMKKVNQFDLFRANAAFRDKECVPGDVLTACLFHGECFGCPPLHVLKNFRIITSTFISTFRLYDAGLKAGHFSHIFLVDSSSAIEPETIVALADLVSEETVVVVTGFAGNVPHWVRSDIGRKYGLTKSFFERLVLSEPYQSGNPLLISRIKA